MEILVDNVVKIWGKCYTFYPFVCFFNCIFHYYFLLKKYKLAKLEVISLKRS